MKASRRLAPDPRTNDRARVVLVRPPIPTCLRRLLLALGGLFITSLLVAEAPPAPVGERRMYSVQRAASEIRIDGILDEPAWAEATEIDIGFEWFPGDNVKPPVATRAYITFSERHLYVGFRAFDPQPSQIRAHLMDRDQVESLIQDDYVIVMLDSFNDERRAFQYRINPLGVQADAVLSEVDGIEDFSWDMIWESKGRITEAGYEVEIAFPFNQLRFPNTKGPQTWGIEVGRSWPRSSRHQMSASGRDRDRSCLLCQFDKITGLEGLEPGRNLEIDPTLTGSRTDELDEFPDGNLEQGGEDVEAGLTVRWGITPSMTLLGTVNPDFSQVEADVAQLAVNERFALFFEEKRPFFLDGIDFFSTPFDAVFTRTVVDPDWGVKLTSKQRRNAVGIFAAADDVNSLVFPSNQGSASTLVSDSVTSGVFRYRRDLGRASTFGVLYTGREGSDYHNRVGGLDGFLRLGDKDAVALQYLRSRTSYPFSVAEQFGQPVGTFEDDAFIVDYVHDARKWYWNGSYEDRGPKFRLDSGFLPRADIKQGQGILIRSFWGREDHWYDRWRLGVAAERTEDHSGRLTDEEFELIVDLNGPLQMFVQFGVEHGRRLFAEVLYDDLDVVFLYAELQPIGAVRFQLIASEGDAIDFSNNRRAEELFANPIIEARLGRHVNLRFDHTLQRLEIPSGELFEANLSQLRLIYNFNLRMFVRGIFQWLDVERDPDLFLEPVEPEIQTLFTQLLFSYKLNARTVLFVGYSDNQLGLRDVDLTRTDRTLFFKLGYAWIL